MKGAAKVQAAKAVIAARSVVSFILVMLVCLGNLLRVGTVATSSIL